MSPAWLEWPETQSLVRAFAAKNTELRFVGGAVRDALAGRATSDVDVATPALPEAVMELLAAANIQAIPTGIKHGTVTAVLDKKHFEITTLRKDVSTDGRHAEVAYTDDWKADAARRDFTMNALYLSPAGELFDYFEGEKDAMAGRVRFIGGADARIKEDYLRILRFFRFYAWMGKGEADADALAACAANAPKIATLSGERIRQEMMKLLAAPVASAALMLMKKDVLRHVFGFPVHHIDPLSALEKIESEQHLSVDPLLRLALLLPSPSALDHLSGKWKLSNETDRKLALWFASMGTLKPAGLLQAQKRLLRKIGATAFKEVVLLRWAQEPRHAESWQAMRTLADEWLPPEFPLTGADLKAIGIEEGKGMGDLLRELEEEWEQSDYKLSREELLISAKR